MSGVIFDLDGEIVCAVTEYADLYDRGLVAQIRKVCDREFGLGIDYDYFHTDYLEGESADDALIRLFNAERIARRDAGNGVHWSVDDIAMTLCHG